MEGEGPNRRAARIVEKRYLESARRMSSLWPAEQVTILELAKGARIIRLHSGDVHEISEEEALRLVDNVPRYFWGLVKVPILLKYVKSSDGFSYYEVQGDVWQRRLVEILLSGDLSAAGKDRLSVSEFKRLVSRYPSLVFVSVSL